jgi:hypothetical protein
MSNTSGTCLAVATDELFAGPATLAMITAARVTTHSVRCVLLA